MRSQSFTDEDAKFDKLMATALEELKSLGRELDLSIIEIERECEERRAGSAAMEMAFIGFTLACLAHTICQRLADQNDETKCKAFEELRQILKERVF